MGIPVEHNEQMRWAFEKTTLFNHKLELLAPYSKFTSLDQFDKQWEMIMALYKKYFTKLQIRILKAVRQRAAKVPGVANASYRTYMGDLQAQLGHTVSRDTIRNTLDKAESMGILIKCFGKRMIKGHGSKTANVVIFNTYNEVYAYKVAAEKRELEEAKKLLAQEYKQAQKMLGIYNEALEMAAAEQARQQEEKAAAKEEAKKAAEKPAKEPTLYQKLMNMYKPSNDIQKAKFKELVAIVYKLMKDAKEQHNMNHIQLEQIMLSSFRVLLNKEGVKKPAAMLSVIIRKKIENTTKAYTSPNASQSHVYVEPKPEGFDKRYEEKEEEKLSEEELEAAAREIARKMGWEQ